jgi:putative DNA primase/helicase
MTGGTTPDPTFIVGAEVYHGKFGSGKVAAVEGNKVVVDFESEGRKRIACNFLKPPARNVDFNDVAQEEGPKRVREIFASATIPLIKPGSFSVEGATEESIAREWVAIHQKGWRYDHGIGHWFHWNGARWVRDEQLLAFHLIGEHLRVAAAVLAKKALAPKAAVARGVESFAVANPAVTIPHDAWDSDPFLLGTPGGTVDLRTGRLGDPDPAHYITRSTTVTPAPGTPARWLQFIEEVTNGDTDLAKFLQQMLGYCLTGSTREHALFFAYGVGKNGKSVLLNTASRILGEYATTAAMDTFTASRGERHSTELAMLRGARLVTASETEEGRSWAEARIKQLTGGDPITARFMRQDNFTFRPQFKLFIVGNYQPVLHNVDAATRRRFNIIPFLHTPAKPDLDLEEKLAAEHPQILQWMIEGAMDWFARGLQQPDAVKNATERYFEDQDLTEQWLDDRCERRPGALGRPKDLFESWRQFATENGETIGTQKALAAVLQKRGFVPKRTAAGRFWQGVDVLNRSHDA